MSSLLVSLCILSISHMINGYYLSLSVLEWKNASNFCQTYCNSNLISIHNSSQYENALQSIQNNQYIYKDVWIGLNDIQQSDNWVWSDTTTLNFGSALDGNYPWRSNEPDYNSIDDCVAIEATRNYQWADKEQNSNYHFLCASCSSKLTKYVAINGFRNYSSANKQCQQRFSTSLASIHNTRDMEEARTVCKSVTNIAGCWIGLNDIQTRHKYIWDDATEFDFGTIFHQYPWYYTQPGLYGNQRCIQIDPSPENYLWDDANCNLTARTLCNAPSEICSDTQFFISNEQTAADTWIWSKNPCLVQNNLLHMESTAIMDKQYFNADGILIVEMMYTMSEIGMNGNAGLAFYFDEKQCDNHYVVGIWPGVSYIFFGKYVNGVWNLIQYVQLGILYNISTYYSLQIKLINGVEWYVRFNDKDMFYVSEFEQDTFGNLGNKLSGYIGIRNHNTSMKVKSLFVSGDVEYVNVDWNLLYLSCNNISTANPTVNPTLSPTMKPTRFVYQIEEVSTTNVDHEDVDGIVDVVSSEILSGVELLWIIVVPVVCLVICAGCSYVVNAYCCGKTLREQIDIMEGEDLAIVV